MRITTTTDRTLGPASHTDRTLAQPVRAGVLAGKARARLEDGPHRRVTRLRDDGEAGAQAAEYAMLGGVSAAACGALVTLVRRPEVLGTVVESVVATLARVVQSWF